MILRMNAAVLFLLGLGATALARDVDGVVRFEGPKPRQRKVSMWEKGGKKSACHGFHKTGLLDQSLLIGEKRGLANVFIYVKQGVEKKKFDPPKKPVVLVQDKCVFRPRILGVMVGQELQIKNSDPVIHNIRSFAMMNRAFNIAQPPDTPDRMKVFKTAERAVRITCDFHKWMAGYYFVMDHPYFAVTDGKGRFKITGLPKGDYTLAAWHETLGEQEAKVTVGADGSAKVKISFTTVSKKAGK